jgi:1-phosphofructokinase family hexose kinase
MILTITLNPAVDLFMEVDRLEPGAVLRSLGSKRSAGGKGINAGRLLRDLGHKVTVAFPAMGARDDFSRLVAEDGLESITIPTGKPVRINIHVVEKSTGHHFKVNSPGDELAASALDQIRDTLEPVSLKASAVVLAGSLPPGLPNSAWARLARMGKRHGALVAIDAEGAALRSALDVPPDIIKVNRRELSETVGRTLESSERVLETARDLIRRGVSLVAVTGHDGEACVVTRDGNWWASPPRVATRRAVGAGDAFLAGLMHAHLSRLGPSEILRWAVACGTAVAHSEEYTHIRVEDAKALLAEVQVRTG